MPQPEISTEHLRLVPWTAELVETFVSDVLNDPLVRKGAPPVAVTEDAIQKRFSLQARKSHWSALGYGAWAATNEETGELIGSFGIELGGWPEEPLGWWKTPELTAMLGSRYQGRGIAGEAGREVVCWAFTEGGLERLLAICLPGNDAARIALERSGMTCLGVMQDARTDRPVGAVSLDVLVFEITTQQWSTREAT